MNRRRFLSLLGIGAPAALALPAVLPAVAAETLTAMDWLRKWKSYPWHHATTLKVPEHLKQSMVYFDKDLVPILKHDPLAEAFMSRNPIKFDTGVRRQFFQYETKS